MKRSLLTAAFVTIAGAAHAQAPIDRGNNESVTARQRPEYEAIGVRVGTFELLPSITFGAESNDNIFAAPTNETDDVIFTVKPEISLASDWSRHALRAHAEATRALYQDFDSENFTNVYVNGDYRLDVGREHNLGIGGSYLDGQEPRNDPDSPFTAAKPVEYSIGTVYGYGVYVLNRLRVSGRLEHSEYDYQDAFTTTGVLLPQEFRNHSENAQTLRFEYAVSPSAALVLRGVTTQNEYDRAAPGATLDRDSTGYRVEAGFNADITNLIRGELIVGYLNTDWDNTNLSIDGLAVDANLEYFLTRLTTVSLKASRGVEESGLFAAAQGKVTTRGELRVDHELLRNVLLTGAFGASSDEYEGIDRTDDTKFGDVGATYLMNRRISVGAHYYYFDVQSDGVARDRDYTVNRLMATLTLKL
ncbi:MAG: outer membrane beta-barrel protein [Alphaproteobacteria bacterium]